MRNLYTSVINYLIESSKPKKSTYITRLANANIDYIHEQCLAYLYKNIDINYLITVLKENGYDINDKNTKDKLDEICETICSDIAYNSFTNTIKDMNLSKNTDEIYDDLLSITDLLSDIDSYVRPRIKSIIYKQFNPNKSIIDFNALDFLRKRKLIYKMIKRVINDNPKKYCIIDLKQNISKIDINKISPNNFLRDFIEQYMQLLIKRRSQLIDKLVADTFMNFSKMLNVQLNKNIKNDIEDIIISNLGDYCEIICSKAFTDEKELKRLLNKHTRQLQNIKKRVMKAYDNIKEWLKVDYPGLKLYKLTENNIYIYPDDEHPEALAFCTYHRVAKKFDLPVAIYISQSIANSNQTRLTDVIYHELIHTIKGNADLADEIADIRLSEHNPLSDDEYQKIIHNDEIWDQGVDMIKKHTHLNVEPYYNVPPDLKNANDNMSLLKKPHEASIVCYKCGWFNVYPKWNNECTQALNNNFECPKCHSNNVKLIPAQAGEQQLLEDALAYIHYQVAEQMPYMPPDESRLRKRKEYQDVVKNHYYKDKSIISYCMKQIPNIVTNNYIKQVLNDNSMDLNDYTINDVNEICETIAGDICHNIFNKAKNDIQSQLTYDKFIELNDYSDLLEAVLSHIIPIISQMLQ